MLDIRFIRENAERVQVAAEQKGYKNVSISDLLAADAERKNLQQQVDDMRAKRNENSAKMKGSIGKPDQAVIDEGKSIKIELAEREKCLSETSERFDDLLAMVPNITFDDVPLGGEEDSVEVKVWGEKREKAEDHLEFAVRRGWLDFERGAKVAGTKFYYVKSDLMLLENAIYQYALNLLISKGFTPMTVPHMVSERVARGSGFAPKSDKESNEYFIDGEDMMLIGTAEAPLTGYHADEIIDEADLPLLYAGYSPCYRKEAGAAGKFSRGLFRVHQFNKLEMYAFALPEQSRDIHEKILGIEEEIWQGLGIPYHVINIAAGDLGAPAAKKYDLEYWSPVDGQYRELTSCSNCTDFQARSLNIRVRRRDGKLETLHTLNGTAVSLARSMVAIIENYQTEGDKLRVPEVLQPYLGGRTEI
jgi:seryl-tRNA synthetase